MKNKVAVIMGSSSDLDKVKPAINVLKDLGIAYSVHILSAHRTTDETIAFARDAHKTYSVIICAAGMAAHLAGIVAANTTIPVIGIPISARLGGMDALLSTVQMPSGIPVATVAIDGAKNAAILSAQILALDDNTLSQKLIQMRDDGRKAILEANSTITDAL
ncbi:MAG: 5-(carboxyamino)imidazole ribonucleotide mutase [Sphaerochaetaceae bacterium]|nr:5-(carboxyamino)imidazole ribonucleotide mutase [Sphaerochaetaceae bacterium]